MSLRREKIKFNMTIGVFLLQHSLTLVFNENTPYINQRELINRKRCHFENSLFRGVFSNSELCFVTYYKTI